MQVKKSQITDYACIKLSCRSVLLLGGMMKSAIAVIRLLSGKNLIQSSIFESLKLH